MFKSQGEHFNPGRWVEINAKAAENDEENVVEEEDVNYALENQHNNVEDNDNNENDFDGSDNSMTDHENPEEEPTDMDSNDEYSAEDNVNAINNLSANDPSPPKGIDSELGEYWKAPTGSRVACVYWIANLDDFIWYN